MQATYAYKQSGQAGAAVCSRDVHRVTVVTAKEIRGQATPPFWPLSVAGHPEQIDTVVKFDEDTIISGCNDGALTPLPTNHS
jgi:hypothetical protein